MKIGVFILTLILSSYNLALGCDYDYAKICTFETLNRRNQLLRQVNIEAFQEIKKDSEMQDLICKHFNKKGGKLEYDFLWNRDCWNWSYRKAYKRMGIKTCNDFILAGATNNFILNCQQLLNAKLVDMYYVSLNTKTRRVIEKVKANFLLAVHAENYRSVVERKLRQIINMTHIERNLSVFQAQFVVAKDLCDKVNDYNFCSVYSKSERLVLSLGAHALYDEEDLELFIAKKFAEFIVDDIRYFESLSLQKIYLELLSDFTHQWKIENLLARAVSNDLINSKTLKYLLVKKYINASGSHEYFNNSNSLSLLCPANYNTKKDKSQFYFESFNELHPRDAMELMLCE